MKQLIISCEHGGNFIPDEYKHLFLNAEDVLHSHRGWDPGALKIAQDFHKNIKAPLFYTEVSRLLIEPNRSLHHPSLFSFYTNNLSESEKKQIINRYYLPYRNEVEDKIKRLINKNISVLHLSIHSFTPILNGIKRNCEIGLLYDPQKKMEKDFCKNFKKNLMKTQKKWRIRMNYPYKGTADGFTTYLRKRFPEQYSGIEIEVNQALLQQDQEKVSRVLISSYINAIRK